MTEATLERRTETQGIMSFVADRVRGTRLSHAAIFALASTALLGAGETALAADSVSANDNRRPHYSKNYVALGDSVAGGFGLPIDPNASQADTLCGRSPGAYSSIVADTLNIKRSENVACRNAVVGDFTTSQTIDGISLQPQFNTAFAHGIPRLITMTIGANDVDWAKYIGKCSSIATCDTDANTSEVNASLASLESNLGNALDNIRSRPGRPPKTIVTGYYQSLSSRCVNTTTTASEITWFRQQTNKFNKALRKVTKESHFARFAPVDFKGHDLCSRKPWIIKPGELGAFHPNSKGQKAFARSVIRAARS